MEHLPPRRPKLIGLTNARFLAQAGRLSEFLAGFCIGQDAAELTHNPAMDADDFLASGREIRFLLVRQEERRAEGLPFLNRDPRRR